MKKILEIQDLIDGAFQEFLSKLLKADGQRLKYYYWTTDFFETVGNLSFKYYALSSIEKDFINEIGKNYFVDEDVFFEVNKNSHRHDITIKNINKLFRDENKSGQSYRYEYVKEFILWQIVKEIAQTTTEVKIAIVEQQKKNFLLTYLNYLIGYTKKPIFLETSSYIKFTLTSQGEELDKKLKELEIKGVDNNKLRNKIDSLYVHREEESKIHFVFSREGGAEKEELRELLDVMGRKETGKLYRGQANSTWKLDSSLTREPKYVTNEAEMYYDILSLKPDAFAHDHSVYDRLITMQHYGMPTRLMDITRNPLVSIFFACNNLERANVDGVVYTFAEENKNFLNFEDPKLHSLKKLFDKSNCIQTDVENDIFLSDISFIKGVAKNQRISNQSGDFIFVGSGNKIEEKLIQLPALSIIIDSTTKKTLLEQLESLNIHGGSVYPDLTHMSNYIRNKFLNENNQGNIEYVKLEFEKEKSIKKTNSGNVKNKLPNEESKALLEKHFGKSVNPVVIETLVNDFDENSFWNKSRDKILNSFANTHKLNINKLKEIINFYYFKNRVDTSDIRNALLYKISLIKSVEIVNVLIQEIELLAIALKEIKE